MASRQTSHALLANGAARCERQGWVKPRGRNKAGASESKLSEFKRDLAEEVFRRTRRVRRNDNPSRA